MKKIYLLCWPLFMFLVVAPAIFIASGTEGATWREVYLGVVGIYESFWMPRLLAGLLALPTAILAFIIPSSLSVIPMVLKILTPGPDILWVALYLVILTLIPAPFARKIRAGIRAKQEKSQEQAA